MGFLLSVGIRSPNLEAEGWNEDDNIASDNSDNEDDS